MKIDVSGLMNRRTDVIRFDYTFDPAHTDAECVLLPKDVKIPEGGIRVSGTAEDSFGCMMFRATVAVSYKTVCARCLDEIDSELEFDIERMILTERLYKSESHISEDDEWDGETEDVIYVNDARIIPDADIMEEISLTLPGFELCSDDCLGLCPMCGKPKKNGDCGCKEEKNINPKLAILQKLLDNPE